MKKISSMICATMMFLNSLLHIALIFGAPLGEFVLGGKYTVFPLEMRKISVFFAILWALIGLLYLKLADIISIPIPKILMQILLVINTIFHIYAIYGNLFFTESIKETMVMVPNAIIISTCSIIALVGYRKSKAPRIDV